MKHEFQVQEAVKSGYGRARGADEAPVARLQGFDEARREENMRRTKQEGKQEGKR